MYFAFSYYHKIIDSIRAMLCIRSRCTRTAITRKDERRGNSHGDWMRKKKKRRNQSHERNKSSMIVTDRESRCIATVHYSHKGCHLSSPFLFRDFHGETYEGEIYETCGWFFYSLLQLALIGHEVVLFLMRYAFNDVRLGLLRSVPSSFFHTYVIAVCS